MILKCLNGDLFDVDTVDDLYTVLNIDREETSILLISSRDVLMFPSSEVIYVSSRLSQCIRNDSYPQNIVNGNFWLTQFVIEHSLIDDSFPEHDNDHTYCPEDIDIEPLIDWLRQGLDASFRTETVWHCLYLLHDLRIARFLVKERHDLIEDLIEKSPRQFVKWINRFPEIPVYFA